jgi:predicted Zn-ribbon and HTH transcriptional regulator
MKECKCSKCGYKWFSRVDNPKACPKCKVYIKDECNESNQEN